ncbi:MAG: universal stress protein [Bacteroidota bacterium]|nr:universal stress protein [Bacteroidota bacterium]
MKRIIVPTDFSEHSLRALEKAVYMARHLDAAISVLYVKKVKKFPSIFSSKHEDEPGNPEQNIQELIQNTPHEGIDIDYSIHKGTVSKEIIRFAEEKDAYMIIMGTHGISGFEEIWMGSNAYRVVTNAHCPVLTTRGLYSKRPIKKIVLPIDTTTYTRHKVPLALDLAKAFKAEIHVTGVCMDETEEFVRKIANYCGQVMRHLNKAGIHCEHDILTGSNATEMTLEYARKVDADLICIMTEQETSITNTFLGPYAQQMVNHSPIPVISLHKRVDLEGNVSII